MNRHPAAEPPRARRPRGRRPGCDDSAVPRFTAWRLELGLSRTATARELGPACKPHWIDEAFVRRLEGNVGRGNPLPPPDWFVRALAAYAGIPLHEARDLFREVA